MTRQGRPLAGLWLFLPLMLFPGITRLASSPRVTSGAAAPAALQSVMSRVLQELGREFSVDHTVHWQHTVPHYGQVNTSISVAPTNFDGCVVDWSQTQEATRPGEFFYIETHRFEVPLAEMDPERITIERLAAGQSSRPGIEAGDYFTVRMPTVGGRTTVNMVEDSIVFDPKKGPIATNAQLMVSSAWVRVRQEEKAELLKLQFQKAIASCLAAGE
ncbi:MAG: hypothetical protein WA192_00805 [Candidatus Acidiferrales bacterium]